MFVGFKTITTVLNMINSEVITVDIMIKKSYIKILNEINLKQYPLLL